MGAVELVNVFFSLVVRGVTDLDVDVWFCVIMEPYADGGKGLDAVFSAAGSPDAVVWSVMLIFGESNHVVQGIWRMGLGEEFVDTVKSGAARSSYFVIELCQIRQEEMVCVSQCPVLFCLYVPDAVFADFNVRDFMGVCHEKEARALEVIFHFERFFDRGAIAKECCESAALAVGEPYVFGNRFSDGGEVRSGRQPLAPMRSFSVRISWNVLPSGALQPSPSGFVLIIRLYSRHTASIRDVLNEIKP